MNELIKRIADHLGLDPLPVKFEDISDDSKIYFKEGSKYGKMGRLR